MRSTFHFKALIVTFGCLWVADLAVGQSGPTPGQFQDAIRKLRQENLVLQRGLAEANKGEKQATEQLSQVKQRLEALGKNLLDGGNDRLVQAAADLEIEKERSAALEGSTTHLAAMVQEYLQQAVVSDPEARVRVETSLRELDAVLGLRQKPRSDVRNGSLQQARIVSIDQESGMMVFNLGESQGAKIGMTFRLTRGQQPYGKAILADVRKGVCGAFVEHLDQVTESPRPGDLAVLETQASAQ
jgi:hypothetical protein